MVLTTSRNIARTLTPTKKSAFSGYDLLSSDFAWFHSALRLWSVSCCLWKWSWSGRLRKQYVTLFKSLDLFAGSRADHSLAVGIALMFSFWQQMVGAEGHFPRGCRDPGRGMLPETAARANSPYFARILVTWMLVLPLCSWKTRKLSPMSSTDIRWKQAFCLSTDIKITKSLLSAGAWAKLQLFDHLKIIFISFWKYN